MNVWTYDKIMEYVKTGKNIVLVGAGIVGVELLALMEENNVQVMNFFDNAEKKQGDYINGVLIEKPSDKGDNIVYIICAKREKIQHEFYEQLISLGISKHDIVILMYETDVYDMQMIKTNVDNEIIREAVDKLYYSCFKSWMNWEKPSTYNEKLNWEKVYDCDPIKTKLADKYLVRNWVAEKIGEEYLTRLYGVWDTPEEIDYRELPSSFVLKTNNGSARNIIVPDKSKMDEVAITKQFLEWKEKSHYYIGLETQYRDIVPKIICEEYLEGVAENLYDYDVFCFHGEPKYIWCIKGSHRPGCKASFYDLNWNKQEFSYGYPIDEGMAPKPDKLDEMLELSRKLSQGFKHARVDWYEYPKSRHGILFSEITFTTWAGLKHFFPPQYDEILGKLI